MTEIEFKPTEVNFNIDPIDSSGNYEIRVGYSSENLCDAYLLWNKSTGVVEMEERVLPRIRDYMKQVVDAEEAFYSKKRKSVMKTIN